MAASMVLSGHGPRKQLAEKVARVMQLLDNDADESDLKLRKGGKGTTVRCDASLLAIRLLLASRFPFHRLPPLPLLHPLASAHRGDIACSLPGIATSATGINLCGQRFAWACETGEERRRRAGQEQPIAESLRRVGRQRAALQPPHSPDNTFPSPEDGFSGRQHAEIQLEEEDYRGVVGGGADGGGVVGGGVVGGGADGGGSPPLSRWHSHSLAVDSIEEDPTTCCSHTLDRRPAPSQSLPDCRLPRR
ncbi:unnamed protein product [Closterium sp. Naga37s-1]|nr:unnamed protein product [Closterium sp. Naga37s-1]